MSSPVERLIAEYAGPLDEPSIFYRADGGEAFIVTGSPGEANHIINVAENGAVYAVTTGPWVTLSPPSTSPSDI